MERWVGVGLIAHDLRMIAQQQAARAARQVQPAARTAPRTVAQTACCPRPEDSWKHFTPHGGFLAL